MPTFMGSFMCKYKLAVSSNYLFTPLCHHHSICHKFIFLTETLGEMYQYYKVYIDKEATDQLQTYFCFFGPPVLSNFTYCRNHMLFIKFMN